MDQLQVVTEITKEIKQKMIFVAMEGSELTGEEAKEIYNQAIAIEKTIKYAAEEEDPETPSRIGVRIGEIPRLPDGDQWNPYARIVYFEIWDHYLKGEFFTHTGLAEKIGCSRTAIPPILDALVESKYIELEETYKKGKQHFKYKPLK
ncbi:MULTISPECIES: hypothetical protein [Bacillus cereus group]|uniref:hypothetical protein n=1 Tax=Bacillus cereus group TaxID=86661 RepID=UPI0019658F50|nr:MULTISPECIES: hypothetical protein [Bacillus cereus group]HDR7875930.1 hypothetical protein [Bacillus mobilis]MBM6771689.1 hypothetical protein [Bacillus cereus]MCC2380818.1 helix-turn-helix domain-containing protein [Bacillus wiedmannii]MCC2424998.1 helix-turn-helix domain-containing protein [Bacillus wiedmannii]MCU5514739.1 helix-turn-helix domain-containing protein [Bacillus wiedmannii]